MIVGSMYSATVNVIVGHIIDQCARLCEVQLSAMHAGRLIVAIVATVPKPLAPVALRNPSSFMARLLPNDEPKEPLKVH